MAQHVTKQYYYLWIVVILIGMLELGGVRRRSASGSALVDASSVIGDENGELNLFPSRYQDDFCD